MQPRLHLLFLFLFSTLTGAAYSDVMCGKYILQSDGVGYFQPRLKTSLSQEEDKEWPIRRGTVPMIGGVENLRAEAFDFGEDWVSEDDGSGHGCVCIEGVFDEGRPVYIEGFWPQFLSRCAEQEGNGTIIIR